MDLRRLASRLFMPLLCAVLLGAWALDAQAARLGGGKPPERQSVNAARRAGAPPATAAQSAQPAANSGAAAGRPWGGMLGALATGLGLTWLAQALGLGPAFANALLVLLLLALALGAVGILRRWRAPAAAGGDRPYSGADNPLMPRQYNPTNVGNDASARPWEGPAALLHPGNAADADGSAWNKPQGRDVPAGFDSAGFLDAAKRNFVTLQNAWDRSDIPALRAMMTDEMLAQIQSQLAERERAAAPGQVNQTDVVMLQAQLLGLEELDDLYMTSVEFSGLIREEPSAGPSPFREIWNMTKPKNGGGGWLVAAVQALQ